MTHIIASYKYSIGAALIAIALSVAYIASAEESSPIPSTAPRALDTRPMTLEEQRENMQERVQERRAEVASTTAEFKERIEEHRAAMAQKLQDRVYNLLSNITGRMDAAAFRLGNIANRIESRTDKLKDNGVNGDAVKVELEKARASLDAAQVILSSDLRSFVNQDRPRERFLEVRGKLTEAGGHIRDAHKSLLAAFAALKAAVRDAVLEGGVSEAVRQNENASATHQN